MSRGLAILCAASLLSAVLGSVHAFSVFLAPLEAQFGASRAAVSLTYSLALVCLTLAVLLGHRLYARWSAARFLLVSASIAAAGALLAGAGASLLMVWLGYSVLFGGANGLGYGFGLQIAAQANPGREGLAMGVVTAAYALGAVVSPALFSQAVAIGGFGAAIAGLAGALLAVGLAAATMMRRAEARFQAPPPQSERPALPARPLALMWLGYFGGVMAGLMVIGHAAGIAAVVNPGGATWLAPVVIAACNLGGSLLGGRAVDSLTPRIVLTVLPGVSVLALLGLAMAGGPGMLLICLGVVGFAYGGTIAAYPAAIAKRFGMQESARAYGRVFTAWGTAGLAGPWLAGVLFDGTGDYLTALLTAAVIGAVSVLAASSVFQAGAAR